MLEFLKNLSLNRILPAVLILIAGFIVVKLLLKLFDRALQKSRLNKTMFTFLKTLMRILLYCIVGLIAAASLGIDVTSLVAVLSVASLAISLAVQNTLANVVGSVTLLTTQPFHAGDFVEIGSHSGTVEEITLTYTKLTTVDGHTVYIPNSDTAAARICNYTVAGKRRIALNFTASYEHDTELVKAAIAKAAETVKCLEGTEPQIYVSSYQDSAIEYQLFVWTVPSEFFATKMYLIEAVKQEFDRQGIVIPYNQLVLHVAR